MQLSLHVAVLASMLSAALVTPANAQRRHVDHAVQGGSGSGLDWLNAWDDLQDALAFARLNPHLVDEIWVADGTYKPTTAPDRFATFELVPNEEIYGGFLGDETGGYETDIKDRDIEANETILSGDIDVGGGDDSYHVVSANDIGQYTRIDGFTITGGRANGYNERHGGGMKCDKFNGGIIRCTFRDNHADYGGGGIFLQYVGENPTGPASILNCRFFDNSASNGVYGTGGAVSVANASAMIVNSLFYENTAETEGGAIFGSDLLTGLDVINCTIADNTAGVSGGGVYAYR